MKTTRILSVALLAASALPSPAFTGEVVNGLTNVALPAPAGESGYKGYVEADATMGMGNCSVNFITLATSQGYRFNKWLYAGGGIGVDFLWSKTSKGWGDGYYLPRHQWHTHEFANHAFMIPVFTDVRFGLGSDDVPSLFLNLRLGAAFLVGDDYLSTDKGILDGRCSFYMQPAVGVRIPVNGTHPRQAFDIGLHYRLMTQRVWRNWQHEAAINGLGLNITYEW